MESYIQCLLLPGINFVLFQEFLADCKNAITFFSFWLEENGQNAMNRTMNASNQMSKFSTMRSQSTGKNLQKGLVD